MDGEGNIPDVSKHPHGLGMGRLGRPSRDHAASGGLSPPLAASLEGYGAAGPVGLTIQSPVRISLA